MFRSGKFVAEHVDSIAKKHIQPGGVDISVESIGTFRGSGVITDNGYKKAKTRKSKVNYDRDEDMALWRLGRGGYKVNYRERVSIPRGHIGLVFPRSRLLRNGAHLTTAIWDPGYEGVGCGHLQVSNTLKIEPGCRVGQFALAKIEDGDAGIYRGTHQHENTEDYCSGNDGGGDSE